MEHSSLLGASDGEDGQAKPSLMKSLANRIAVYHGRTPVVKKIPLAAVVVILGLFMINIAVWAGVGIVLVRSILYM